VVSAWFAAAIGCATGVAQTVLLRRATGRGLGAPGMLVRVLLVASVLFATALSGLLAAAVAGWAAGFGAGAIALARRAR
jgi:hypothetical protein